MQNVSRGNLSLKYWAVAFDKDTKTAVGERQNLETGEMIRKEVSEVETPAHARLKLLKEFGGSGCDIRGLKGDPYLEDLMAHLHSLDPKNQKKVEVKAPSAPLLSDEGEE